MLSHLIISLVALAAQDAPATSAPGSAHPQEQSAPAQPTTATTVAAQPVAKEERRTCTVVRPIGSRIPSRVCMTPSERALHEKEAKEFLRRAQTLHDGQGG